MKALFWSLVFLCSMGAYAGLPAEDSYIKDLRSRFQNAQKPLEDDLYEIVFSCEGRNAMKGDFNSDFIIDDLRFFRTVGYLPFTDARNFRLDDHALVSLNSSYVGYIRTKETEEYIAFRVGSRGELLIESSVRSDEIGLRPIVGYPQNYTVKSYGVCFPR